MVGAFHLGCAVWGWRGWLGGLLPEGTPQRDFLRRYAERLTAVEGNTLFYAVPSPATLERWASEMAPGFRMCPKLPRAVTHDLPSLTAAIGQAIEFRTLVRDGLGEHLGPCFAQLPPTAGPERIGDLERFVVAWQRAPGPAVELALEVRHPGWFTPPAQATLDAMLRRHGVGRVTLDTRAIYEDLAQDEPDPQRDNPRKKPQLPVRPTLTARFALVRYIGHPELARNAPHLEQWAAWVTRALARGIRVFFFAHCPEETCSPDLARDFQARLEARGAPVPPLPWNEIEARAVRQRSLF